MHTFFIVILDPKRSTLFAYTTLFRSSGSVQKLSLIPNDAGITNGSTTRLSDLLGTTTNKTDRRVVEPLVIPARSEEHTSELQPQGQLLGRRLLDKKNFTDAGSRQ